MRYVSQFHTMWIPNFISTKFCCHFTETQTGWEDVFPLLISLAFEPYFLYLERHLKHHLWFHWNTERWRFSRSSYREEIMGPSHEWPKATRERMPASRGLTRKKCDSSCMEDREALWQSSPGPGKSGLRGMAKGSPLQETSKKDMKWIRHNLVSIVRLCCPLKALPPFSTISHPFLFLGFGISSLSLIVELPPGSTHL